MKRKLLSPQPLAFPARNTPVLTLPLHLSRCSRGATTTIAFWLAEEERGQWSISICRSQSALSSKQLELVFGSLGVSTCHQRANKEAHRANPCGGSRAYCQDLGAPGRKTMNLRPAWTRSASSLFAHLCLLQALLSKRLLGH